MNSRVEENCEEAGKGCTEESCGVVEKFFSLMVGNGKVGLRDRVGPGVLVGIVLDVMIGTVWLEVDEGL